MAQFLIDQITSEYSPSNTGKQLQINYLKNSPFYLKNYRMLSIHLLLFTLFISSIASLHTLNLKRHQHTIEDYAELFMIEDLLSGSAQYIPFKYGNITIPPRLSEGLDGVVPLVNFLSAQFYGEAQLGTPEQNLKIMFDTGSSNMFVLAPSCVGLACWGRTYYNYSQSNSFFLNGSLILLEFGSGNFTGFIGADKVSVGGLAAKDFSFALIDNPDAPFFLYSKFDGIVGLAYDEVSVNRLPTLFSKLLEQKVITEPSYSFYLTRDLNANGSAFILGGIDKKYAKSEFHYVPIIHKTFFMTDLDDFSVGNKSFYAKGMNVLLDTGTSLIVGPDKYIQDVIKEFPSSIDCHDLSTYPNLHFVIGGKDYSIPPEVYIFNHFGGCVLGIAAAIFPPELEKTIILGDVFIRQYYTHFDYGNGRLGFAEAANVTTATNDFVDSIEI